MLAYLKKLLFGDSQDTATSSKSQITRKTITEKKDTKAKRIGDIGEYKITVQLDQLPRDCRHIDDLMIPNTKSKTGYAQVDHVVITRDGIFVIETKNYQGTIYGQKKDRYWTVNKRFRLYNPLRQNFGHIKALETVLQSYGDLRMISIVSFTMRCRFRIDPELRKIQSDELVIYDTELSEYIRRKRLRLQHEQGSSLLSDEQVDMIYQQLMNNNITDPSIRKAHQQLAGGKQKA